MVFNDLDLHEIALVCLIFFFSAEQILQAQNFLNVYCFHVLSLCLLSVFNVDEQLCLPALSLVVFGRVLTRFLAYGL